MSQDQLEKMVDEQAEIHSFSWKPLKTFLPKISPRGQQIEERTMYVCKSKIPDNKLVRY
jgi:hypothetical protein